MNCQRDYRRRISKNYEKVISESRYFKNRDDLCAFYKNKVDRLDRKFSELWNLLDKFNLSCKESTRLHSELQSRTSEVTRLQLAVSDLQASTYLHT